MHKRLIYNRLTLVLAIGLACLAPMGTQADSPASGAEWHTIMSQAWDCALLAQLAGESQRDTFFELAERAGRRWQLAERKQHGTPNDEYRTGFNLGMYYGMSILEVERDVQRAEKTVWQESGRMPGTIETAQRLYYERGCVALLRVTVP
jgi:hypothetical protein